MRLRRKKNNTSKLVIEHINHQRPPLSSKLHKQTTLNQIELVPLSASHRDDLIKYASDIQVARTCDLPHPFQPKDADNMIAATSNAERADFVILYQGQFAGVIGLGQINIERSSAWVSYWVAHPFWRRGIATQALEQLKNIAKNEMGLQILITGVWSQNPASKQILVKHGFKTVRCHYRTEHYHNRFNQEHVNEMICHL
ncbi:GNAT family N-acetyltransferase [Pseudoalteromonas luteoviolacea]|uniref:GNAT family N-acetyltransferase n=1 Tax=Pseudoalteromonas luteoviolacea TaxID=43657 RepID=UPI001F39B86F|nr:GNAT family N-acetyltransferase [Pseudoalteromonas luteoviolacea]MCF6442141.1 GNAT family N-acetyltransferase [Pseudoalteromonas luteoviolacea]